MNLIEGISQYPVLATFFTAMLPIFELRGALPVGVYLGLSHLDAFAISVIGNLVPVPFIIIFIRRIFAWMKLHIPALDGFVARLERKAEKQRGFIHKWQLLGLFIFVAIPLPGTGAWTGALIAALMDIRLKNAFPAIAGGVVVAGIIIFAITYGITSLLA